MPTAAPKSGGPAVAAPASGLAGMHPAYFALVMATGIVSLACHVVGVPGVARVLFGLNLVFYPLLWVLTVLRGVRHRARLLADVSHHGRAVGFFTTVAATCVLGSQCLVIANARQAAFGLWGFGIALYFILVYTVFTVLTVKTEKPPLAEGLNGGWLVSVVAAQSVATLGAQLAPGSEHPEGMLCFSLVMWLGGGMLYFWIISLIFYRYTFFALAPSDLAPPYWINMGAAAISTLAGASLTASADHAPLLLQTLPFVRGLTLFWWATATWWIPMLLVLGVWRHVLRRFPVRYDPLYWGAVFPLGMYTVATARLSAAVDAPYLFEVPRWTVWVALAAWATTFCGMMVHVARLGLGRRA
jgi:tellurite resistance protein TehA-like permease